MKAIRNVSILLLTLACLSLSSVGCGTLEPQPAPPLQLPEGVPDPAVSLQVPTDAPYVPVPPILSGAELQMAADLTLESAEEQLRLLMDQATLTPSADQARDLSQRAGYVSAYRDQLRNDLETLRETQGEAQEQQSVHVIKAINNLRSALARTAPPAERAPASLDQDWEP